MQRALKIQVHVGKDHIVRLPSEFPEGPAEVIVITTGQPTAAHDSAGVALWADIADDEYDAFTGSVHRLRIADRMRSDGE